MSDTLLAILHMCIFPGGWKPASSAAWARP